MSKSQLHQDIQVLGFYKQKKHGFFIEIGASDGVTLSNTHLLEKKYEWKGICVEPIPQIYSELVKNRPNSKCFSLAVYNKSDLTVSFSISHESSLYSGITENIDYYTERVNRNKTIIDVTTVSLTDLLDRAEAPTFIEYLSLDTEGSEYKILNSFNFEKYTIGLIDVEHNWVEPRRTQIRELLLSKGYIYKCQNKFDDIYYHKSLAKQDIYYYRNNLDRPITVSIDPTNSVSISSSYWPTKFGFLEGDIMKINNHPTGKVTENSIEFQRDNIWHK
jgi:FkbM family methyltransferase